MRLSEQRRVISRLNHRIFEKGPGKLMVGDGHRYISMAMGLYTSVGHVSDFYLSVP